MEQRIIIIGTSACGKTSLGCRLSRALAISHHDLDDFYWLPKWTRRDPLEFRKLVDEATQEGSWIVTGNYNSLVRDIIYKRATLVIWIDLPFSTILWRGIKRGFARAWDKQAVCNGNYESFSRLFFNRDSILKFIIRGHFKKRRRYLKLIEEESALPFQLVRLQTPEEVERFAQSLSA